MRIALIGARGQLGRDLEPRLPGEIIGLDLPECDVRCEEQVARHMDEIRPNLVVNCAGLTDVEGCENGIAEAMAVNATGAAAVARQAARCQAAVMYISSDYVFGVEQERTAPYSEQDSPGPINIYGASKLAGEHLSRILNPCSFIVRSCGLFGHGRAAGKGGNFVETVLDLAAQGRKLRVVNDQRVSPTNTAALADRLAVLAGTEAYGLYHIAAPDSCTWYEFAVEILRCRKVNAEIEPISSRNYATRARRPAMSALVSVRSQEAGISSCPPYREMLREYLHTRGR